MSLYISQHIDAFICIAVGVFACWYGARKPKTARTESQSNGRLLRVCGVVVIAFALLRFASSPKTRWERKFTADGHASAEFPGVPMLRQSTDSAFGMSLPRSSLVLDVPHKDIALFLSYTPQIDDEQGQMSHQERVELLNQMLSQQGLEIVDDAEIHLGNVSGSKIEAQGNG